MSVILSLAVAFGVLFGAPWETTIPLALVAIAWAIGER